jgi:hypothetical protein
MSQQYLSEVGSFTCRVIKPTSGWFGESKDKGTPFIRIPLQVEDESDDNGKTIVCERYITDGTIDRLVKDLVETFGWDGDLVALESAEGDEVPEGFAGQLCSIVTEDEPYNGASRIKVKWLNSVDYKPKQMAADKVKSLLSKFNSRAKAIAKASGAPTAQPKTTARTQPTAPIEDDEIPF